VKSYVNSTTCIKNWTSALEVLNPAVIALRYTDGKKGGSLGLIYSLLLQLDELYCGDIKGIDKVTRQKVSLET
jgi:hypothetical protein